MSGVFPVACVFMAAGISERFGANKLLANCGGRPLIAHVLARFPSERFIQTLVVTRYEPVRRIAEALGYSTLLRRRATERISGTIRVGLRAVTPEAAGCLFAVCDQPKTEAESILRLARAFLENPERIAALGHGDRRGNPVIFPRALFSELLALPEGESGGYVLRKHPDLLTAVEAESPEELRDIDTAADWEAMRKN